MAKELTVTTHQKKFEINGADMASAIAKLCGVSVSEADMRNLAVNVVPEGYLVSWTEVVATEPPEKPVSSQGPVTTKKDGDKKDTGK